MGYLVDSHCHLHDREFFSEEQAEEILNRAKSRGIEKIICIGTDPEDSKNAKIFAKNHKNVFWTYGIHPENAEKSYEINLNRYIDNLSDNPDGSKILDKNLVGIGEIGLDYHYSPETRERQIKLLEEMLDLAVRKNLPISFHIREAFDDFFGVIENFKSKNLKGVIHSFSDSKKNLKKILETTDFYIGVNGLATYSTLPTPPLDRILLETDAPFLTPKPFRGIINEPGYIREVAIWLSEKLNLSFKTIEEETTKNVQQLFKI